MNKLARFFDLCRLLLGGMVVGFPTQQMVTNGIVLVNKGKIGFNFKKLKDLDLI